MKSIFTVLFILLICAAAGFSMPPIKDIDIESISAERSIDDTTYVNANNILSFVSNLGLFAADNSLLFGKNDGFYFPFLGDINDILTGTQDKTVVYSSGLVMGGKIDNQIRTAVALYDTEFVPGNMIGNDPAPDNESFKVYKIDASSGPGDPDYDNWPSSMGAPVDEMGNPLLIGDQTLWAVYNDAGEHDYFGYGGGTDPLGIEVQQTVWASNDAGEENVVYLQYKLYNRGSNAIDSFYFGFTADPDIGFAGNDLVGCDSLDNIFYAYNGNSSDAVYGSVPPAWGGKVVYGPVVPSTGDTAVFGGKPMPNYKNIGMVSFNRYINGTDPYTPLEMFNYLKGLDAVAGGGTPYIDPNTANVTTFPFSGDPLTGDGWVDMLPGDRRLMVGFGPFTFAPSDSQQVVLKIGARMESNNLYSITALKQTLNNNESESPEVVEADSVQTIIPAQNSILEAGFYPEEQKWLSGVNWGGEYFNGGVDYGYNFWGGYLNPQTMPDSFTSVELRFTDNDPDAGQRAYSYCRGCDPSFKYNGYFKVPFEVWDIVENRQLNVCFVEWLDSDVYDSTWGPDNSSIGGREYMLIMKSDYDGDDLSDAGTGSIDYTSIDFVDGEEFDFMYGTWFRVADGHTIDEMDYGQKLYFYYNAPLNEEGVADSIYFGNTLPGQSVEQNIIIKCFSSGRSVINLQTSDPVNFTIEPSKLDFNGVEDLMAKVTFAPTFKGDYNAYLYALDDEATTLKDAVLLFGTTPAYDGPVWWVSSSTGDDESGDGTFDLPFKTIQKGIDMAAEGDTVRVMSGNYNYTGNRDLDFGGKNICLQSAEGPDNTLIYCHGTEADRHRAFYFHSGEDLSCVVEGFTIRNGSENIGAGALIENSSPTFKNCRFRGHINYPVVDVAYGGAVCLVNSNSRFIDCTFRSNQSAVGAGAYVFGGAPVFTNCIFDKNTAVPAAFTASGAGVFCNESGAVFNQCLFTKNTALDGAAMMIENCSPEINNCTYAANESTEGSGIIRIVATIIESSPTFTNTLIAFNDGISVECIDDPSSVTVSMFNCDVFGNSLGDWVGCIATQDEDNFNVSVDPMFCGLEYENYMLDFKSPCLADNNLVGQQIGALGYGCGYRKTRIDPYFLYAYYAFAVDSVYADIYLWDVGYDLTVHDVDTNTVMINESIKPSDFQYIEDNGVEKLKMTVNMRNFVNFYWPLWDTTMQIYEIDWTSTSLKCNVETFGYAVFRGHITGDVNGDGKVDIVDITYLVDYIYREGRAPIPIPEVGDMNGSSSINMLDITYLINYLMNDGPAPVPVSFD